MEESKTKEGRGKLRKREKKEADGGRRGKRLDEKKKKELRKIKDQ